MATEITATSLVLLVPTAVCSTTPCCGTTTASSPRCAEGAAPATGLAPSSFRPSSTPTITRGRPPRRSARCGMPLESWILRSALGTPVDPYLTAASALARSARAGLRCDDGALHPPERHDAAGRGGKSDRARGGRRRHPHRVRDRGARPESDPCMATANRCSPACSGDDRKTVEELFVRRRCRRKTISN